jgi:hypothetical protein
MKDAEMYRILDDFANSHTLARDLEVRITEHSKSFTALPDTPAKYEDVVLLSQLVLGAEHFMMWLRREGKARLVKLSQKVQRKK